MNATDFDTIATSEIADILGADLAHVAPFLLDTLKTVLAAGLTGEEALNMWQALAAHKTEGFRRAVANMHMDSGATRQLMREMNFRERVAA